MSVKQLLTVEEFLALPEPPDRQYELVRGEVVEVPPAGPDHHWIVGNIYRALFAYAEARQLGAVFGDGPGYVVSQHTPTVLIPDVSFIADARVPATPMPKRGWSFPPDLAVEVVSPTDRPGSVQEKVQLYLAGDVPLVWVVWPEVSTVTVHTPDTEPHDLTAADTLAGGDVLPGFAMPVADVFKPYRSRREP